MQGKGELLRLFPACAGRSGVLSADKTARKGRENLRARPEVTYERSDLETSKYSCGDGEQIIPDHKHGGVLCRAGVCRSYARFGFV